jgi:SAM-dependent methyltransferase
MELTESLRGLSPGLALDLASGSGRHAMWLRDAGWSVTAVDLAIAPGQIAGVECVRADLERGDFAIASGGWDLIVCWLYWQENLLAPIAGGARPGGVVALAGKASGRFATSLERYRSAFTGWEELCGGQDGHKAFFIGRRPQTGIPPVSASLPVS